MVEEQFQGQPIGYYIRYYPRLLGRKSEKFERVKYTTNTTTLTSLTVYTVYVINVSAVSSGGTGPAKTVNGRTGAEGRKVCIKESSKDNSNISNLLVIERISIGAFFNSNIVSVSS